MSTNGFKREPGSENGNNGHSATTTKKARQGPISQTVGGGGLGSPSPETPRYQGPAGGTVFDPEPYTSPKSTYSESNRTSTPTGLQMGLWFYLIFALSVLNSFLLLGGVPLGFAGGLGLARLLVAWLGVRDFVFLAIHGGVASIFLLIGIFAQRGSRPAFVIGLVLYGVDTVFLCFDGILPQFRPILVHAIIAYRIFRTYRRLPAVAG